MQLINRVQGKMTRTFMALYLVFATLISTTTIARAATTGNATAILFPRVYVADILTPEKEPSTFSSFPAEVDLLDFSRVAQTSFSKISFLVHDEEELARLTSLAKKPKTKTIGGRIDIDLSATEDLWKQIEYTDEGEMGLRRQQASVYTTITDYSCYKNLQGSFQWMDAMVLQAQSITGLSVTKSDIGNSYNKTKNPTSGYDIWVLKITGTSAEVATKGILFMMSGIHAREYSPPELASRWVESLINQYGVDGDITAMLDSTEIHLVLQSNPDARQVAETNRAAMRRKNMNLGSKTCLNNPNRRGVDLNRNFPYQWGLSSGSSADQCAETYRGTSAGSEPEVKAIIDYTRSIFPAEQRKADPQVAYPEETTRGVFLDIHSYSNLVLLPWLYSTTVAPPNRNGLTAIRDKVQFWNNYAPSISYTSAGTTTDYAFKELGAASFVFELGTAFYQDCATFESTIYPNNVKPLMHLAKISKAPFSMSQGPDVISANIVESTAGQLTITAIASDSAWSKNNVNTTQQEVTEIRAWVGGVHPYSGTAVEGYLLVNGSVTVDVSSLASARHLVYVQAKDSAGYRGPVTAVFFVKN